MEYKIQFWDWFGDHGCFFLPLDCEKDSGLLNLNSLESMEKSLNHLFYDRETKTFGVETKKTKRIHDPMELLPLHNEKGISFYEYYDEEGTQVPEITGTLSLEEFMLKYPLAIKLI